DSEALSNATKLFLLKILRPWLEQLYKSSKELIVTHLHFIQFLVSLPASKSHDCHMTCCKNSFRH
ncbi:hypothetical protein Bpfe_028377, partial [Biomphalaria pfeifferi]